MNQQYRTVTLGGLVATLLLGFSTLAVAQERQAIDITALGPQVGDTVPDFSLPDQNGQIQTRESIMGPNGVILLFHRSADW
jgi:hypothetical protein